MKWLALPTWTLTTLLLPFMPEHHPWRGRYFTLEDWHAHQTDVCREIDFGLWIGVVGMVIISLHMR